MVVKSKVAGAVRLRIRSVASWLSLAVGIVVTGAAAGAVIDGTPADGLDEIVVTAQRRSENLEKVAVAVSVLRSEDLVNKQIETEEDLQSAVPGLTVRSTQNNNLLNYAIRGQSVDAFTSSKPAVLPYIDEVQVNNNSASAFYDLGSVQVLKGPQGTLFGRNATGGAVLFTTNKPNNDVDGYITTRFGNYDDRQVEGALNVPIISDKVLLRIAGFHQDRDGFQTNLFDSSKLGDTKRSAGRISLTIKATDALTNDLVVDYADYGGSSLSPVLYSAYPPFSTNASIPATGLYGHTLDAAFHFPGAWAAYLAAHPQAYPPGLYAYQTLQNQRGPFTVDVNYSTAHHSTPLLVSNITTFDLGDDTQLKNIFGYQHSHSIDYSDFDGSPFTVEGARIETRDRQVSDELQLLGKALNGNLAYVTWFYFSDDLLYNYTTGQFAELLPLSPGATAPYISDSRSRSYAGYAQGTYDLSSLTGISGLGVTAGARYTSETVSSTQLSGSSFNPFPVPGAENPLSANFKKPSWQFGLQDQLNSDVLVYAVTRRSFRSGGYNVEAPPFPGTATSGGAGFAPEIATDVEFGVKFQGTVASIPTRLNVAAYNQWVTNIQRSTYVALPSLGGQLVGLTVNIPKAIISGVEVDGQISPLSWLNVGGSFAYTDAKFTENQAVVFGTATNYGPFADTPRWTGAVFAEAATHLPDNIGKLSLRSDVYTQSLFYFSSLNNTIVPGTEIPSYFLVNARLALSDIRQSGFSVALTGRNLTNKIYYTGGIPLGSVETLNSAIPGDPRTFTFEATYKF